MCPATLVEEVVQQESYLVTNIKNVIIEAF